ncbi:MAG: DUF1761 family protein [Alphaproteobacteria bacterium]|nr:DUF1761 family protein [Alphaproteobacteria bacterium]
MEHGINWPAIVAAAIAGFAFGAAYYMTLGRRWMAAAGKSEAECKAAGMAGPMIVSAVAQLVVALMLSGLLAHLKIPGVRGGLLTGASVWFGFSVTVIAVNYAWQRAKPMLTVIDGGHWLGVLLIQGAILGAMGS